MKIHFVTLALDAMPYISHHINQFNKLDCPWSWSIIEGVAKPFHDTSWVKSIPPRLSRDGTHEYLVELAAHHPRVTHYHAPQWPGKTAMLNHALSRITEPGLVFQTDSDELYSAAQLHKIHDLFEANPSFKWAQFFCDYQIGGNIRIIRNGNAYGNNVYEWFRCWSWRPGQFFSSHEPPVMQGIDHVTTPGFNRDYTANADLVFTHPAYALEKQVEFKRIYYGYEDATEQWRALQSNTEWPVSVSKFLKWVPEGAMADLICKP